MILEALHTKINPIINAFPLVGDIEADVPFAVYNADVIPLWSKQGIIGYEYTVIINVIDTDLNRCISNSELINTAILALAGTTTNSTKIDSVQFQGENHDFNNVSMAYVNELKYTILTNNK